MGVGQAYQDLQSNTCVFKKLKESKNLTKCKCRQKSSNGKQEPHGDSGSDLKRGQGDVEFVNSGRRLSLEAGPGATFTPSQSYHRHLQCADAHTEALKTGPIHY